MVRLIGALFVFLTLGTAVSAQSWDIRIAQAFAEAKQVETYGAAHGWSYGRIGTFTRKADIAVIRCVILAEMIGVGDIGDYVEFWGPDPSVALELPDPSVVPDDGTLQTLLTYGWNLQNWAIMAGQSLDLSDDQRGETWELYCNGRHGIPAGLLGPAWDTSATFRMDGARLYVVGDIEPGFYQQFAAMVAENEVGIVMLGSRGGSVLDAMQAGGLIRQKGLQTELFGDCESACPLLYFSGQEPRIARLPLHRLGFHQIAARGEAIPLDSPIYETVGAFIEAMGIDSAFVLAAMRSTPPDEIFFPGYQSLCDANVGWFYGNCTQGYPQ